MEGLLEIRELHGATAFVERQKASATLPTTDFQEPPHPRAVGPFRGRPLSAPFAFACRATKLLLEPAQQVVNRRDRQYRAWRALSKNRLFFGCFNLLPGAARRRMVDGLEGSLARTNRAFRGGLPLSECEAYARPRIRAGASIIVFGHFHEERRIEYREGSRNGAVFVLPAWREGHRYLRIDPGAEPAFVSG